MDDNPNQKLTEKIEHFLETAHNLEQEYESLLQEQMQSDITGDSDFSVASPLANDVTKRLKAIDLALESNQQQLRLALESYLATQPDLPSSPDCPMSQCYENQMRIAKATINQQVELFDDNDNDIIEVKLNQIILEPQALFTGTLPDDFYLHLLSVLGIQECLLNYRLVCSLWNDLILERCHNQKSLKVFETFDCLMNYGELLMKYEKTEDTSLILKAIGDELVFEGLETDHKQLVNRLPQEDDEVFLDEEFEIYVEKALARQKKREASQVLTILFPNIEELVLCPEDDSLIDIVHLLQFYAKQLTSLTITEFGSHLSYFSFPCLKSLNTFNFLLNKEQLLSLLPQLESLTMSRAMISLETILRTGTQLCELNIKDTTTVYSEPVDEFSARGPLSSSNLRKFSFSATQNELQVLEFISQNLTSLECLKLELILFYDEAISSLNLLTYHLAPLTQLHSLTLEVPLSFFLLDDNQITMIKPLQSVRQLKLLLWDYDSLPTKSMDLFSRSLFRAFPNAEQALIGFVGYIDADYDLVDDGLLYTDTLTAFQDFAGKHANIVQLFRTKDMSRFTALPNSVSPLLGHYRQVYEDYIAEEELFGVTISQLAASLVPTQPGEVRPNLKIALRAADRLAAMSNLLQLLEGGAFALTYEKANKMLRCMFGWALDYDQSQVELFSVTCKSVLFLLDCRLVVDGQVEPGAVETPFLLHEDCQVYSFYEMILILVEHTKSQQLDDQSLLQQLCKRMVKLLMEFDSIRDDAQFDEYNVFKVLLELADYYKTEQLLNVLDPNEELLPQINHLIDDQLEKFDSEHRLESVIRKLIRTKNGVYRNEMEYALTRCGKSADGYFNLLNGEVEGDSADSDSGDSSDSGDTDSSDSSESDSSDSDSSDSDSDSSDSITSDGSSSSAESDPELWLF